MAKLSINDAEFYYQLQGKGHPLVLISGYTCDNTFWAPVLDALSAYFQVFTFDNRCIGQTKNSAQSLSAELLANDVIGLIRQMGFKNPHVIGHSMGGTIAQTVAARYGKELGKLVIMNSSSRWRQAMLLGLKSLLGMRKEKVSADVILDASLAWIFGESFLENNEKIATLKDMMKEDLDLQTIEDQEKQFEILTGFDGRQQLKNIQSDTLIVYGKQDLISLPDESKWMASQISNAKLVEFDCAHGSVLEIPEKISDLLIDFLS